MRKLKILVIKFKYLGDVAVSIPALRALRECYPHAELHFLVAEDAAPIVEHIPWIDRVWAFPRKRGKMQLSRSIPMILELKRQQFDLSIDLVGNDRGALLSYLIGAEERLGPRIRCDVGKGFMGREHCYTLTREEAPVDIHESLRNLDLLKAIGVGVPTNLSPELRADPSLKAYAQQYISQNTILCHLSTSMPKKEWPLEQWIEFFRLTPELAERIIFITGPSEREKKRLEAIQSELPDARVVTDIPDLRHLMALIDEAEALICGDTAPAHLAAGLGTPYVAIFGPSTVEQWDPMGNRTLLIAQNCSCWGHPRSCLRERPCLADISAQRVYDALNALLSHGK